MKVLITGAHGLVGSHLMDQLGYSHEVLALGRTELDITNAEQVFAFVEKEQPDLVINCAVLGVDECESDHEKAQAINVHGSSNLAQAAAEIGAEIIHFSTNYVFDGERETGYYTTDDEPKPINVYGQTKLEGERAVQTACERSFIIRTSWVFGKGKSSFLSSVADSLKAGRNVSAITDRWASTTFVSDLVERVEEIINRKRYDVYHVVNSGICSYYEYVLETAKILGAPDSPEKELIEPIMASDAKRLAPRPRYSPMCCKISEEISLAPMRDWQTALRSNLNEKMHEAEGSAYGFA